MPITQDLYKLKEFRAVNPQLDQLSDTQLADLVNKQTGELGDLAGSSALGRVVAKGSNTLGKLGQSTETGIKKVFGESYPSRVVARAGSMAVQSAPEYIINLMAAKAAPNSPLGATALGALNFGLGYGRTAVETGDTKAALGSGVGNVVSLVGSLAGSKIGAGGARPDGAARRPIAAAAGGFLGSLPGDAIAIASQPEGLQGFLSDSTNLPAMLLSNLPYAGIDKAREIGETAKLAKEKKVAATPSLDEFVSPSLEQTYVNLSKIPVSQMTEQQATTMRNISRELRLREENKTKVDESTPSYDTVPESQATILAQVRMLAKGKKDAVMVPKGTAVPKIPFELQPMYASYESPSGDYFMYNPSKLTPQAIEDSIKSNTLGNVLGYGVPNKPTVDSGYTAVLRDAKGLEKQAVVIGDNNEPAVMAKLEELREPGDSINKEKSEDVIENRLKNRELIKDYSLQSTPETFATNAEPGVINNLHEMWFRDKHDIEGGSYVQLPHWIKVVGGKEVLVNPPSDFVRMLKKKKIDVISQSISDVVKQVPAGQLGFDFDYSVQQKKFFQNTVLRALDKSLTTAEKKNGRFQPDAEGNIGSKGVLKAIEQWAPKEMFEHYKNAGLPTLLGADKVSVASLSDWIQKNTPTVGVSNLKQDGGVNIVDKPVNIAVKVPSAETDNNVVASVNGYFKMLPSEDKALFIEQNNQLADSYQDIVLKAAVKHAVENGATKIVLQGTRNSSVERMTGDAGKPTELGRVYDVTNVKPEVEKLFSLYGLQDQHDLTARLAQQKTEIEKALVEGREVTPEEFVDASLNGENTDNAILVKYLKNLSGSEGPVKLVDLVSEDGLLIKGISTQNETAVNAKLRGAQAIRTAAHEFSHGAMNKLQWGNPEAYADNVNYATSLGAEGRKMVLQSVFDKIGMTGVDIEYLAGEKFKKDDPRLNDKIAREFYAGLSEALAHTAFNDAQVNPFVAKTLSWLPVGAQRWLSNLPQQWTKFFGPQYPSGRHYLEGDDLRNVSQAYQRVLDFTYKNESAQGEAFNRLKRLELLDPSTFIDRIQSEKSDGWLPAVRALNNASPEFRDYAVDYLKETKVASKVNDFYEDNFLSALYRTKIYPETLDFFNTLHHFRNKIKTYEHGYLSFLGQNADNTLGQDHAIKNYNDYITKLISPFAGDRNVRLERMSKVITKNQEIREGLLNPTDPDTAPVGTVREDQLVSRDEMINKFGLSEQDADFLQRLVKLPKLVAEQSLRKAQEVDTVNLSKLFYLQNKNQNIDQVKNKVAEMIRTTNEAGSLIVERKFYENYVNELKKNPDQNAIILSQMESKIFMLQQQETQLRGILEAQIRKSFDGVIPFNPNPGEDAFVNQITAVANRLAEARAEQAFIMRDEGYAPMTRRGRFLVKVFKKNFDGKAMPDSTASLQGFKTKQEAQEFVKKTGLSSDSYQLIDKETFGDRAQLYSPYQLQAVRDKARSDFDGLVREYIEKLPEGTPNRESIANALIDIRNQFRPLDQEIKEVISAKGDKFKERRWLVPGFNEFDFIPNIFEYTNYKTIVEQKALTRAEAELQMLRPEVQTNPPMLTRMQRELEYVLGHTDEAAGLRKLIFYSYLGGSVRHVIQNLLQVPLNGIPEMVAQGAGMHAYSHALKAGKLAHEYNQTGTTGNKTFDVLLKQAEKDGVTIPNAIEFFAPESADLQNALDSVSAYEKGQTQLGEKTKYVASELGKGLEKFMRSTAVAGEQVNRRVSFIMSLLESERLGVKDARQMFNKANMFTDYVNFVGDKSNRPGFQVKLGKSWAHSPVLVATALQSFVLNHIGQLYSYGRLALRGNKSYQQAFATGSVHLIAMAGAMGIPFAQTAEQMFESATGISLKEAVRRGLIVKANDWFDIQEKNGGRIADVVLNGFTKLTGLEASQSIGLGDPLFSYQADRTPSALDVMGPLGGLINKGASAASVVAANPFEPSEWMNATRTVAPQALNYWFKLMDATMKGGYYDREGAPVVEGLNAKSSIALLGGFTPTEVSNVRQVQKLRRKIDQKDSEDYRNAVNQVAKNLFAFEQSGDNDHLVKANSFFADYVKAMAGTQDRDSMVKSVANRVEELRHPAFQPPTLKTSRAAQEALASYPETAYPVAAKLPAVVGELKAAQLLGQQDVLQRKLGAAKSAALTSALYDHLIQAGYEPALASLLSQRGNVALRRQIEMSTSQGSDQ